MWPAVTLMMLRLRQLVNGLPLPVLVAVALLALVAEFHFANYRWCTK
jgi:hypothetical protein